MTIIPEEEVASIKDSIAFGLPSHEQNLGAEASGFGGIPVWPSIGQFRVYVQKIGNDIEEVKKMAFVPFNPEKGKMSMDPMVGNSWKSKESSAPTKESASLVGKFAGMLRTTSGGFAHQIAGVGQMKLEPHRDT